MPVDAGGYFDLTPHGVSQDFRRDAITMLERMGISVEFSHHEVAPGQQEIDLRYADALSTADNILTTRHVIKEVALSQGVYATFMPKPFSDQPGSGMHTHLSLFEGDQNAFYDRPTRCTCRRSPSTSSPGCCGTPPRSPPSPTSGSTPTSGWCRAGRRRRTSAGGPTTAARMVRVPMYKPTKGSSTRIEVRSPDSATNPYLGFAVLLAAGLKGIEEGYELPPGAEDDVWSLTDGERRALGIDAAAGSLAEAIAVMERSELVAETLGEHVFDFFLRNKRAEWEAYRAEVTPFELGRYLPVL